MTDQWRNARKWIRGLFFLYLLALLTATHWPQLEVDLGGEWPLQEDKMIHFCAYAGLGILTWFANWFESGVSLTALKIILALGLLAVLDEVTQSLVPGRTFSWMDMVASAGGGVMAVLLLAWISHGFCAKRGRQDDIES